MKPVTDTALLNQLDNDERTPVSDPELIKELDSPSLVDKAVGVADAAGTVISGAIAEPVSGVAGIVGLAKGVDQSVENIEATREALTHDPQTEEGRKNLIALAKALKPVADLLEKAEKASGDAGFDLAGPVGGAIATALPVAALELLGLRGAKAISRTDKVDIPAIESDITPKTIERTVRQIDKGAEKPIAETVDADPAIIAAAEELEVDPIASATSQNRAFIDAEQSIKSRPGSQLAAKEQKSIEDIRNRADQLIIDLGGDTDKSLLDANIRNDFNSTIKSLGDESSKLSDEINAAIPRAETIEPASVRAYLDEVLTELGGDRSQLTAVERKLLKLVGEDKTPTYAALDRVRRDVGNGFNKQGVYADTDTAILNRVYSVLAEDQKAVANAFGVGDTLAKRNELVVMRKSLEDQSIAAFGKDLNGSIIPKVRQAANNLVKGDVSNFEKLLDSVPVDRQPDVAIATLSDLFNAGSRTSHGLGQGFVKAYEGINRNAKAKEALFRHLPDDARRRFDLIGKVSTGIYRSKALENNSKTARDLLAALDDPSWMSKAYGVGRNIALAEGVTTSAGIPGAGTAGVIGSVLSKGKTPASQAADQLLASDKFARAVKAAAISKSTKADESLRKSPEFRRWAKFAKQETIEDISKRGFVPWLLLTPRPMEQSNSGQE